MNRINYETQAARNSLVFIKETTHYALERSSSGWITGNCYNCSLTSAFQPIFNPIKGRIIGHAASIRSESDGEIALSPWHVFALATKNAQLKNLDNLCCAVHALNYFNNAPTLNKLFVSVHPRLLESVKCHHGSEFENILNLIGVRTERMIIDIPAEVNRNWDLLINVMINYRSRGYQVAVNYSSASNYWMTELGSLYPDIMCIEACDLLRHDTIDRLVKTVHRFGAMLLVRNIKTSEQADTAVRIGTDYLQGPFLGEVTRAIETETPAKLSEKFNAFRWQQQVLSADQQHYRYAW